MLLPQTDNKVEKARQAVREVGTGFVDVDSNNRGSIKRWLNGLGISTDQYAGAALEELSQAYNIIDSETLLNMADHDVEVWARAAASKGEIRPDNEGEPAPLKGESGGELGEGGFDSEADEAKALEEALKAEAEGEQEQDAAAKPEDKDSPKDEDKEAALLKAVRDAVGDQSAALDEDRVKELIKENTPEVVHRIELTKDGKSVPMPEGAHHKIMPDILADLALNLNVLLVGPAGSGKTHIAKECSKALEVKFYFVGAVDTEYKLSGFIDAQGRYVTTSFRQAYEGGGLFLFDEMDGSLPNALLWFNAALSNGECPFPDKIIPRHEDFRCLAAANTYGDGADLQYIGRNPLDASSKDRFMFHTMDYDQTLERALGGEDDHGWVDYVQAVRKSIAKERVRHVVSPRASMHGLMKLRQGQDRTQVENSSIWKGMDSATQQKVLANMEAK